MLKFMPLTINRLHKDYGILNEASISKRSEPVIIKEVIKMLLSLEK